MSREKGEDACKRRWCSGIMQDSHSCDPGSIPGRRRMFSKMQLHVVSENDSDS